MSFTIFFFIYISTAVVSLLVSYLAWSRRKEFAAIELSRIMLSTGFYSFFIAFEVASTTLADKVLWSKIAYLGAVTVPVFYFIFIMLYTGHKNVTSRKNTLLLFLLPFITLILTLTNEYHHLIWTGFSTISSETNLMRYYHGVWFFLGYMAYDYILLFFATISLFNFILRHKTVFRKLGLSLLIAGLCPWIAGIVYVTNGNPIPGFDLAPVATGICGIFLIFVILNTIFLDLAPISREVLMETIQDGLVALDVKNRIQDINKVAYSYLGLSPDKDILGMSIESCGISSNRILNAIVTSNSMDQSEVSDENGLKTFRIIKKEIKKNKGSNLIIIRDISEQIAIHNEILAGEERYRNMYHIFRLMSDNMSDMLWAKDLDKKFIFVNKAVCDDLLKAKDTDEPIGKTDLFFKDREQENHPENPEWHNIGVTGQYTDDKVLLSGKLEHFDGFGMVHGRPFYMDVQKAPIFDENGKMIGIVGSARDVTKQKMIERDIYERDILLDAISKATALLIQGEDFKESIHGSFDIIGKATGLNRIYIYKSCLNSNSNQYLSLEYIWMDDFARKLNINKHFSDDYFEKYVPDWLNRLSAGNVLLGKTQDFIQSEKELLESQKVKSILLAPVFIDKFFWGYIGFEDCMSEREWTSIEEHLLTTVAGTIVTAYVRKKDQDELLVAKERAEESDRLKTAFLANLSHEIRTPMNSVLGFVSLLQEPGLTGVEKEDYVRVIKESGDRLLNTIRDIIDIAKIESQQMTLDYSFLDVNEMAITLHQIFNAEAEAKGLKFSEPLLVPQEHALIKTDKNKIYSIMTNLIKNAIKYTKCGYVEIGQIFNSGNILFYVKDTGIGIAEDKRSSVFERFVQVDYSNTRSYEGVGLGLSISKAYVEMLGGKIWFESEVNKGSSFYVQLPVLD
ncbi:MAG TPA: histidine kinase N-terminal 7TM domain-containing protein [Bacteroidales bacterium]